MNKIKLNVFDEEVKLELFADTYFSNQSLAIEAIEEETGENFKTVSVNLPEFSYLLEDNEFFFDENNDLFNIKDVMINAGIMAATEKVGASGFCQYPVFKLLLIYLGSNTAERDLYYLVYDQFEGEDRTKEKGVKFSPFIFI